MLQLPSNFVALDHHRICDDDDDDDDHDHDHYAKKSRTSGNNHTFESLPSMRTSPSLSYSPDDVVDIDVVDADADADSDSDDDVLRPLPKRVVTLNVVRPVPKRISEQFYDEAYKQGSTLQETNQAAMLAHDWHRKWTYQDEAHHTMPEEDFYQSASGDIPTSYCHHGVDADADDDTDRHHGTSGLIFSLEREEGAKNPSLGSPRESLTKEPTKRMSAEASTSSDSSSEDIMTRPQVKRQFTCYDNNTVLMDDDEDDLKTSGTTQRPLPIRPVVVRPLAIRANRSKFGLPQPTDARLSPFAQDSRSGSASGRFPRDIVTNQFRGAECVSPMSHSQLTGSSSISSGSNMMGFTVLNNTEQQEGLHLVEDEDELVITTTKDEQQSSTILTVSNKIEKARDAVLHALAISDGDVELEDFKTKVAPLEKLFLGQEVDTRRMPTQHQTHDSLFASAASDSIDGMWLTLSKPNFFGNLGQNDNGDPMYTLGRMSFDMFSPTNLVCSLQGNFNRVEIVSGEDRKAMLEKVPTKLREEVESGKTVLRTYHVVTAFTIEASMAAFPNAPNKDVLRPIKGIMTTYGYSLPDPDTPNRHSIWFTGGRIEPNNDINDVLSWKNFFTLHPPKHSFGEKAKLLAVKLLMGATIPDEIDPEDGSMNYVFSRPLGGHGMAYVDVVYLDKSLRIVRGQRGTTFVFSRVPDNTNTSCTRSL